MSPAGLERFQRSPQGMMQRMAGNASDLFDRIGDTVKERLSKHFGNGNPSLQ